MDNVGRKPEGDAGQRKDDDSRVASRNHEQSARYAARAEAERELEAAVRDILNGQSIANKKRLQAALAAWVATR